MPQSKKNIYITAAIALVLFFVAIYFLFIIQKKPNDFKVDNTPVEVKKVDELSIAQRPFVTLTPTANGAEIIISIENMSNFDNIEYELTYLADNPTSPGDRIERGSTGTDVNTKDEKYKKSILLGTASRGVSNPDKGIGEGKLTLHLFKKDVEYLSETKWDLMQIGVSTNQIKDRDGNFSLKIPAFTKDYFAILADTVGVPQKGEFDITKVKLPVYGVFSVAPKFVKKADLSVKSDDAGSKLYIYNHQDASWSTSDATVAGGLLKTQIENLATFVVVSSK